MGGEMDGVTRNVTAALHYVYLICERVLPYFLTFPP